MTTPSFSIDDQLPLPHCDQTILHGPGTCEYCDRHPYEQALREHWRMNFTGEYDDAKAPCPSLHFRPAEVRDLWYGNVATSDPSHDAWLESITTWVKEMNEEEQKASAKPTLRERWAGWLRW